MPPVEYVSCVPPGYFGTVPPNGTAVVRRGSGQSDLQALLYIVFTLLFYSLGIIIGIISYLKREKREMLEDRGYDEYLKMKLDPFVAVKSQRVQQYAERIKFLEEQKRLREEEAERLKALALSDASSTTDERHLRRVSRISLLPPDTFSMQFLHKGCQTDDIEKESHSLSSRARKIVKILNPTPSRRASMIHLPRASKKRVKYKSPEKHELTLSSPSLPDDDQLSCVFTDTAGQGSPSLLPTICLPPEDMTSRSTLSGSPHSSRRGRSPVPYIDVSPDDDNAAGERAVTPLLHQ